MELNHHLRAPCESFCCRQDFHSAQLFTPFCHWTTARFARSLLPSAIYVCEKPWTDRESSCIVFIVSWGTGKLYSLGADTGIEPEGTNDPRVSGRFFVCKCVPYLFAAHPLNFYKTHLYFDKPKWNCCLCLYAAGVNRTPAPIRRMVFKTTALPLCLRRLLQDAFLINLFNIWKDCCTRPWDYCLYFSFSPQQWNSVHLPPR